MPNIFKLTWPSRPTAGEHGVDDFTGSHCCDEPKEIYWAVLNALDKHMTQLHFPVEHIAQPTDGGAEARRMFARYAGHSIDDTPDVWIAFRDTQGAYYPDGKNSGVQGSPEGRMPCCRALPNYEWFIYQRNPSSGQVVRTNLPNSYKSLSARSNAGGSLQLDIEDLWAGSNQQPVSAGGCAVYTVEVEYLDRGTDRFVIRYANANNTPVEVPITKQGTSQWVVRSVQLNDARFNDNLPSGADLELASLDSGTDVFHRVRIEQTNACNVTITPTSSPTSASSATGTPTRTHKNTRHALRYPFADANRYCNSSINANTHGHKGSVAHANYHADGNCLCNANVNRNSHTDSDCLCNTNAYRNPYPFTHSHGIPYGNSNT